MLFVSASGADMHTLVATTSRDVSLAATEVEVEADVFAIVRTRLAYEFFWHTRRSGSLQLFLGLLLCLPTTFAVTFATTLSARRTTATVEGLTCLLWRSGI